MSDDDRSPWSGYPIRLLFALVLVMATYNPTGYSYFQWLKNSIAGTDGASFGPEVALAGVVLAIGWVIYLRATMRSLGMLGILLAVALFGTIIWLLIDHGLISTEGSNTVTWIILFLVAAVLATGLSWSYVRRRLSGQYDVDDVDE
jgi:hypothetical protein